MTVELRKERVAIAGFPGKGLYHNTSGSQDGIVHDIGAGVTSPNEDPQCTPEHDPLFAALDHHLIAAEDGHDWYLQVLGIHRSEREVWVQIAPVTDATAGAVLRLSPGATPAHAIAAVGRWSPSEAQASRVIDVMRVVRSTFPPERRYNPVN